MKILVYGAGNIGSLYTAKLKETGNDVTTLARGTRLQEIHEHGILLQEFRRGLQSTTCIDVVEGFAPEDNYDLVLVILPRQSVSDVLSVLAANRNTPMVMFFGNNASGPSKMIDSLGRKRVLLGFPGAAAVRVPDYSVVPASFCRSRHSRRVERRTIVARGIRQRTRNLLASAARSTGSLPVAADRVIAIMLEFIFTPCGVLVLRYGIRMTGTGFESPPHAD